MMNQKPRASDPDRDLDLVNESEIEGWAERERKRRKAWLEGPTDEEKQEWAELEWLRRRRRDRDHPMEDGMAEGQRIADRWQRDIGLALAGIAGRLINAPYSLLGNLVIEGRQREDEYYAVRRKRRRVPSDDDI